jgi:hypothetical protein
MARAFEHSDSPPQIAVTLLKLENVEEFMARRSSRSFVMIRPFLVVAAFLDIQIIGALRLQNLL